MRVAVIGSGPAGVYAAAALTRAGNSGPPAFTVDVYDRLPAPYGLVRYGVAPDHVKMKAVIPALEKVLEHPAVRFLGNVEIGVDLTADDLRQHYDALIFAHGAAVDRKLGIDGEDLPGSFSATEFVAWYSGHPDAQIDAFTLHARSVAVIGVGNVAVDVARVLARSAEDLRPTDVPDHVLDVLRASHVTDVHIFGRRGPAQAKFTTKELRELGELDGVDVIVHPEDLVLDEASKEALEDSKVLQRNLEVLTGWAEREPTGAPRRLHLRFLLRPAELLGGREVTGIRLERNRLDGSGGVTGTGEMVDVDVEMVLRSVGYRGLALPGLPFDQRSGVIPNADGRVLSDDGAPVPGLYVTGWIKRGPTGVIGTNKHDANSTVESLLADASSLPRAPVRDPDAVLTLLTSRRVPVVRWGGWRAIDALELDLGKAREAKRIKIAERERLLAAAGVLEATEASRED